jgi:antitoxin component of RelBE/YafQ-DinJ toxin-antitoxin module
MNTISTRRGLSFSDAIDLFILYLATEKGLSVNYQLSNHRSLQELVTWCDARGLLDPASVQTTDLTDYLNSKRGLAPASLRIAIIAIRLFFRFLRSRYGLKRDPAQRMGIENPVRVSKLSAGFPADRRRSPPLCAPSCSNRPLPCIKSSTTFRALAPVAFFPWAAKLLLRFQPKNMTQHIFSFESELQNNQACLLDLLL